MFKKHLHIISFDIPYPPNYGGVIDVFFKIKALNELGIKIILHCFKYGRKETEELNKYCEKVYYYKRRKNIFQLFNSTPYITTTRKSDLLLERLLSNDFPILFEGLHSCHLIANAKISKRKKLVRMHNIEHDYYNGLADCEKGTFKRWYFRAEARKLKRFQSQLTHSQSILTISHNDTNYLNSLFPNVTYLPVFHQNNEITPQTDVEEFVLYHGNLAVGENNAAALFLIDNVFDGNNLRLIIAGDGASSVLRSKIKELSNIELRENLSSDEILQLIQMAKVNMLITFQATGIKLKLLNVLFQGGHCLVNNEMVQDTGLESLCEIGNSEEELRKKLFQLMNSPVDEELIEKREKILLKNFNNTKSANILGELLRLPL